MNRATKMHKAYCLTVNNPTKMDHDMVHLLLDPANMFKYSLIHFVVGYEHYNIISVKYAKKTPHLQIAMCFSEPKSFFDIKRLFPRAHIESIRTSYNRAVSYCLKEADQGMQRQVGSKSYANFKLYNVLEENYQLDSMFDHCVMLYGAQDEVDRFFIPKTTVKVDDSTGGRGVSITPPTPPSSSGFDSWEFDRLNK